MRDAKLRVWYAPEDMCAGQKLHEQIETAIRVYDKLLVVLSEASLASEWVKTEIRNARRLEKRTGRRKLFPVLLAPFERVEQWSEFDADTGKDLGVELREYAAPSGHRKAWWPLGRSGAVTFHKGSTTMAIIMEAAY